MSGERVGKVLERVADEALATCDSFASDYQKRHARQVLEERLGPLLRAGQAMRGLHPDKPMITSAIDWDAALAALERER